MEKKWKRGMMGEGAVEKIAFGGKGIVREENFVIFVKGALPGQKVKFQIQKLHDNFAEAKLLEVLTRSPIEITSPYEQMPGCVYQNIAYEDQLKIKETQVYEAIDHLAKIATPFERLPILPSPQTIRYRNKVEFSFGYEQMNTLIDADGNKTFHDENPGLGFHPEGDWARVRSFADCFLISEEMNRIYKKIEAFALASEFPVWNAKSGSGFWRQLILRESIHTAQILVNFVVAEDPGTDFWKPIMNQLREYASISGMLVTIHSGRSDLPPDPEVQILFGTDMLVEQLGKVRYLISPFAFFQTNTRGAEQLFQVVKQFADLSGQEKVLDLFCGSGAIGLFLADQAQQVIGLEMDERAVADARRNAQENNFSQAEYFAGKAEEVLPLLLEKHPEFDVLLLDPPRIGLHPKAMQFLLEIPAQRIVYVSCNPATLARDLAILTANGWKLEKVQPVDMFPHTPHIEAVARLQKG